MPYSDQMEAFGMAIEALQKTEKYRWHDLRKNPNDLPTDGLNVIAFNKILGRCVSATYNGHGWIIMGGSDLYYPFIIAWRYIEPFEEDE